jgi:hypothetical protein
MTEEEKEAGLTKEKNVEQKKERESRLAREG